MNTHAFISVFDAIADTKEEATNLKLRALLMNKIVDFIKENNLNQTQASEFFNVTQPRISDLFNGKLSKFSLDALVNMISRTGLDLEITFKVA